MLSSLLTAFLLTPVMPAEARYIRTTYNFAPGSPEEAQWKKCAEIPYSYFAELEEYRKVSREIQNLLHGPDLFDRAGEVAKLREKLNLHSARLNALALPEWNREGFEIDLTWVIPGTDFFPPPETDDRGWPVQHGRFLKKSIERVTLMGERRNDLQPRFRERRPVRHEVLVNMTKAATFLEFCQFVRTIEVEITVRYLNFFESEKKFKLIFEELQ